MPRADALARPSFFAIALIVFSSTITLVSRSLASDTEPTTKINEAIRAGWHDRDVQPAPVCSDRTFVRRVYLDLAGRVPTTDEVNAFINDESEAKRKQLIDQLLESEDHAQHFADLFDTLLMGRGKEHKYDQRAKHGWRGYLETVFRDNRRWDEVAGEILLARPSQDGQSGAVWFLYERDNQHQAIAESIAPAFFGIRIECAQCHDHMVVDEIRQEHYWGLVAFFNRGKNENTPRGPRIPESAIGGFSEFADLGGSSSPNLLTFLGVEPVDEQRPGTDEKQADADEFYTAASVKDEPRVPKFSRREQFVRNILKDHPMLARAMVNRVWAILMGRGIVHPFDEMDSMHPPSHPELLDWLAQDFTDSGFDVRRLVRNIANSDAYQLSSVRPSDAVAAESFAWYLERPLTAEQYARSVQLILRGSFQNDAAVLKDFRQQFHNVLPDQIEVPIGDALFMSNGKGLDEFIRHSNQDGQLIHRLSVLPASDLPASDLPASDLPASDLPASDLPASESSHHTRASRLVEAIFGRPAAADESQTLAEYLESKSDRLEEALAQATWAMLNSAEFRFNH